MAVATRSPAEQERVRELWHALTEIDAARSVHAGAKAMAVVLGLAGRKPNFNQFRQRDKREMVRYLDGFEKNLNEPPYMRKKKK